MNLMKRSQLSIKQPHCEGAQDLIVAKDCNYVTTIQSVLRHKVNESLSALKIVEPISLTLSSIPTKTLKRLASKSSDVNVAATVIEPKEASRLRHWVITMGI